MNTLSEQLTELYNEKWSDLMEQLEANGLRNKLQCPFLISVLRSGQKKEEREKEKNFDPDWHSKQTTPGHEEWYTKADIKIMFFGQEPHGWEKDLDVGDTMAAYEDFLDDKYVVEGNSGYFNEDEVGNTRMFSFAINGIMSCMRYDILQTYPDKKVSMIWNNISKLSTFEGAPVDSFAHEIEHEYFHVIPKEVEILKPDILIFFTGPRENKYYKYIQENFTMDGEPLPLANLSVHDVARLPIKEVALAYKTHHPNSRISDKQHWDNYGAILADIKENIDKLLKKE